MNPRKITVLLCLCLALTLTGCSSNVAAKVASQLDGYKNASGSSIVQYFSKYHLTGGDTVLVNLQTQEEIALVCPLLIEKTDGLEVPWLCVNAYRMSDVLPAMSGLRCASLGLILDSYGNYDVDWSPLKDVKNLNRFACNMRVLKNMPTLESVTELILYGSDFRDEDALEAATLDLERFPALEKLMLSNPSMIDPGSAGFAPKLTEVTTVGSDARAAVALFGLLRANPQIQTVNGEPAAKLDFIAGLDETETKRYNAEVQRYDIGLLNTDGFATLPYEQARLHGAVAVVGLGDAAEVNGFAPLLGDELPSGLLSALTADPFERDVVVSVTVEHRQYGTYIGNIKAFDATTYLQVIDLSAKTMTERMPISRKIPDSTIEVQIGKKYGDYVETVDSKAAWAEVVRLYEAGYER